MVNDMPSEALSLKIDLRFLETLEEVSLKGTDSSWGISLRSRIFSRSLLGLEVIMMPTVLLLPVLSGFYWAGRLACFCFYNFFISLNVYRSEFSFFTITMFFFVVCLSNYSSEKPFSLIFLLRERLLWLYWLYLLGLFISKCSLGKCSASYWLFLRVGNIYSLNAWQIFLNSGFTSEKFPSLTDCDVSPILECIEG